LAQGFLGLEAQVRRLFGEVMSNPYPTYKTNRIFTGATSMNTEETYNAEEDTAELVRVGKLPKPLRLAAMLEKTMQWPLHGKAADCLREMYDLLQGCETEMRYAGWDKRESDNTARNGVYEKVKILLEKNT
jgi:hypothetical protein